MGEEERKRELMLTIYVRKETKTDLQVKKKNKELLQRKINTKVKKLTCEVENLHKSVFTERKDL